MSEPSERDALTTLIETFRIGVGEWIGTACPVCGKVFRNLDDIGNARFGHRAFVHKVCWDTYERREHT